MGKFDGILLCSDWDGTLAYSKENNSIAAPAVPQENIDAIRYFQENGGIFTVCSGRYYTFLENYYDQVKPNTYVVCYGGALMVEPDTMEVLYSGCVGREAFDFIDEILSLVGEGLIDCIVTYDDAGMSMYSVSEYAQKKAELALRPFYKCVIRGNTPENSDKIVSIMKSHPNPNYLFVRSWAVGHEIIRRENSKGMALRRLKEHLGARLAVAVGDHENDIDMLQAADISYAVGDGHPAVLSAADRVSTGVREGAVARVIYDIEKELGHNTIFYRFR